MIEIVKKFLPTNTSKVLIPLVFTAVPSSLFLYDFLNSLGIKIEYLAKPEIRFVLALATLSLLLFIIVVNLLIFIRKIKSNEQQETPDPSSQTITPNILELSILTQVIKFRALNQAGSPVSIAKIIDSEPQIVLAHLNKLHKEQQVTYITGGKPPTIDTDFFICPKGLERISFQANTKKKTRRVRSSDIRN